MDSDPTRRRGTSAFSLLIYVAWLVVVLVTIYVDRPVAEWCLGHRNDPAMLAISETTGAAGSGALHAVLILFTLAGTTRLAIRRRTVVQWLLPVPLCAALFVIIGYQPLSKDSTMAVIALPVFLLVVLVTAELLANRPEHARVKAISICKWLLLAITVSTVFTTGVKMLVRRPRPEAVGQPRPSLAVQIDESNWHSFPSGDALVTTTLVIVLWGLMGWPRAGAWLLVLPVVASLQRVTSARHHPGDVMAGMLFGIMWGRCLVAWAIARGWPPGPRQAKCPAEPNCTQDAP